MVIIKILFIFSTQHETQVVSGILMGPVSLLLKYVKMCRSDSPDGLFFVLSCLQGLKETKTWMLGMENRSVQQ